MTEPHDITDAALIGPYSHGADTYMASGIGYPIPSLRQNERQRPVPGFTGKGGAVPSTEDIERWKVTHAQHQVLLRLPKHIVGIDVDAYGEKSGQITLRCAEKAHGALPPTLRSSARGDDNKVAGIRFFLLEAGMDSSEMHDAGLHVETIRFEHRFAVVFPSWNEKAEARYAWYGADDARLTDEAGLNVTSLAIFPWGWYDHLRHACDCFAAARRKQKAQSKRYRKRRVGSAGRHDAVTDFVDGIEELTEMPEGSRNNSLSKLAGRTYLYDVLMAGALTYEEVTEALYEAAEKCGLETTETERTIESAGKWAIEVYEEKGVAS